MAEVAVKKVPAEDATKPATMRSPWNEWFRPMLGFRSGSFLNPFAVMKEFAEEIDRSLAGFPFAETAIREWVPAVEYKRQNGNLVVLAELPGLKKEEVTVEITPEALTLKGERKREEKEEKEGYFRSERTYGRFYRYVPLPEGANVDKAEAKIADGVLTVTVPIPAKKENRREIEVKTAG
jgi:HSP20 family protein